MARQVQPNHVFLNLPFDSSYESKFLAYISALASLGLNPRCVLEISPDRDRLRRLKELISRCPYSLHDLSYVGLSRNPFRVPRFNMPFELGLCAALADGQHRFRVFEKVPHRLGQSLSDLLGYEPFIHRGSVDGVIEATLDAFAGLSDPPLAEESQVRWVYDGLRRFRRAELGASVFTRRSFQKLTAAAVVLVADRASAQ